ncbi:MAG: cation:proton antiporter [Dysgonamonadaceae bacterium]|nr:cation:proton antiporter [Dysgonamonadaceae bacterium]
MLLIFGILMYLVLQMGSRFETTVSARVVESAEGFLSRGFEIFSTGLEYSLKTPVAMLLLQMIAILFTARVFGLIFIKMGQPSVIGEIIAGIVLGPSVLAHFFPEVSTFLFSQETFDNISILSQIGLILFMFVIGMELDISEVRKKMKETLLISHAGIIVPFFCGILAAYWTYSNYASGTTPFVSYALFIGVAMSITAFPVLARILQEKGLTKSHLGTLSLASAANGDVTAWCLLAAVIAIAQSGTFAGAIYTILFSAIFLVFMFFVIRPFLNIIGNIYRNKEVITKTIVAFMLLVLIISAYVTEVLGVHALFGAFMAGVVMPSNPKFRKILTEKVEDISLSIFLPLFFVSTGLKTQIGLIGTTEEWITCLVFILFAVIGKVLGTAFAARITGEPWKDSWSLGALMNTRGLMELIVLTIGYEMGILPQAIFVMLVLMTLATTVMTGPLMNLIDFSYRRKDEKTGVVRKTTGKLRVLLSFGRAGSGQMLLNVAEQVFSGGKRPFEITALHLTVGTEINPMHTGNFEELSFEPILEKAKSLQIDIKTRYEVTNDAGQEIVNITNHEGYDFLLVGAGISMSDLPEDIEAARHRQIYYEKYFSKLGASQSLFYPGDLLKDKTHFFIEQTRVPVGIFVNREFTKADKVIVVLEKARDVFLLDYARNLMVSNGAEICIHELGSEVAKNKISDSRVREFLISNKDTSLVSLPKLSTNVLVKNNFMLISYDSWMNIMDREKDSLQLMPSTLIISNKKNER